MRKQKTKYYFVDYLKVLAIILITNSHFDDVYPWPISFGGAPGNTLFFMISGFLLASVGTSKNVIQWYWKRIKRIYPSVWVVTLVLILGSYFTVSGVGEVFSYFIYPTAFWFIASILVNYVLFYLVRKADVNPWIAIVAAVAVYFYRYIIHFDATSFFVETLNRGVNGFIAMMLGALIKDWITGKSSIKGYKHRDDEGKEKALADTSATIGKNKIIFLCVAVIALGGFLGTKLMIGRVNAAYYVQFLTHLFSLIFAIFSLLFFYACESRMIEMKDGVLCKFVGMISACSLEIYMIQRWEIELLCDLAFPLNFVLIILIVLVSAWLLHKISDVLVNLVEKGEKKINSNEKGRS